MNNIEIIAERFETLLDTSKTIPFSDSIRVRKQDLEDLIYELKLAIPDSIKEAEDVIDNCHQYVDDAQEKAEYILENAKMEASKLISDHEIYKQAVVESERIKDDTTAQIHDDYNNAIRAIDELLSDVSDRVTNISELMDTQYKNTTEDLKGYMNEVYEMRQELRKGQ